MANVQLPRSSAAGGANGPPVAAPVPESLVHETGYLLRRAYVHAGRWTEAALPDGPPVRHYEILQALSDLGPCSQQELGEILWVNRTIMVKLIDALEHSAFVERRRNPADRRSYALRLTIEGQTALAALSGSIDRAESGLTATLGAEERETLRARLARIARPEPSAQELPTGLARRICTLLTPAHHRVRERIDERLHELDLTTALYGPLATIAARSPISQQAVADQLGLTGPAILQTVDRLEAGGLVRRGRDATDRRSYALKPTASGEDTLRHARAAIAQINQWLDDILGGELRREELNRLLRKLLA